MKEAPTKPGEVAPVKVRLLQVAVSAAVLSAASLLAVTPTARESRTVAVVHVRTNVQRPATATTTLMHVAPVEAAPGPAALPPAHPKAAHSLRPVLPWWFHRRHIAAPQPALQIS